jgi:hypothetical protein
MRPNSVRLREDLPLEDLPFPDEAPRANLDALETAKARQDLSHQKLDEFIAAALAELSDEVRAA